MSDRSLSMSKVSLSQHSHSFHCCCHVKSQGGIGNELSREMFIHAASIPYPKGNIMFPHPGVVPTSGSVYAFIVKCVVTNLVSCF